MRGLTVMALITLGFACSGTSESRPAPAPRTAATAPPDAGPPHAEPTCRDYRDCADGETCGRDADGAAICVPAGSQPTAVTGTATQPSRCLDEVGCLLATTPPPCCSQYRTPVTRPKRRPSSPRLSRAEILAGIRRVQPRFAGCAGTPPVKGRVVVRITIAPSGRVAQVTATSAPTPASGRCIEQILRSARFPRKKRPTNVSYPVVLR